MSQIVVTTQHDGVEHCFDTTHVSTSYIADTRADGTIDVSLEVYEGNETLATIPVASFPPHDVDGFEQR